MSSTTLALGILSPSVTRSRRNSSVSSSPSRCSARSSIFAVYSASLSTSLTTRSGCVQIHLVQSAGGALPFIAASCLACSLPRGTEATTCLMALLKSLLRGAVCSAQSADSAVDSSDVVFSDPSLSMQSNLKVFSASEKYLPAKKKL